MEAAETIVSGGRVHRPLMQNIITEADEEKARRELRETRQTRDASLRMFRELLSSDADLVLPEDDEYLIRFLRVKKHFLQSARRILRDYYDFRAQNPGYFPDMPVIVRVLREEIFNYLPHRDHQGRAIFLIRMNRWDPKEVSVEDFVAAGLLLSEYVLDNPVTQINGYVGLWDFQGFSFTQARTLVSNVTPLVRLIQDCFPGRLKMAYCVNCHKLAQYVWPFFRIALREKYQNRVLILRSNQMRVLHQYLDPSILPEEYGGRRQLLPPDEIIGLVSEREQHFNEYRNFGFRNNQNV